MTGRGTQGEQRVMRAVLCCGDREWSDWPSIWRELRGLGPGTVIVHGDCRGADRMCGYVAERLGYPVHAHPAEWLKHGKRAGPIRNQQMLDEHPEIELVLAFHNDLAGSRGTADMVRRAREKGVPVNVVTNGRSTARAEA